MRNARLWALTGAVGLAISFTVAAGTAASAATPAPHRVALKGSLVPAQERSHSAGGVAANAAVSFDLLLSLRNAAGAQAFVKAVSTPGSSEFHHYLTDAQWTSQFGPTSAEVASAESWLRGEGFTVGALPKDRLFVPASGTAAQVEKAFGVTLGYYTVNGHTVRLAKGTMTIPSSLAGAVTGAVGINQVVATTSLAQQASAPAAKARTGASRSTPRTRDRCTSRTPIRCPTTSAATSPRNSAALPQPSSLQGRPGQPVGVQGHPRAGESRLHGRHPGRLRELRRQLRRVHRQPQGDQLRGPETYCDATGNCATRNVTLTTAPGFDSLTGLGSAGDKFIPVLSKY